MAIHCVRDGKSRRISEKMQPNSVNTVFKQKLRNHLEKIFPNHELARWFDPLRLLVDGSTGVLRVAFPHPYFRQWFSLTVQKDFERQARELASVSSFVYEDRCPFPAHAALPPRAGGETAPLCLEGGTGGELTRAKALPPAFHAAFMEDWSFESFIANHKNEFAVSAAKEAASTAASGNPTPYNPFVLHGQSGSGKSHLLAAMALKIREGALAVFSGDIAYLEGFRLNSGLYHQVVEDCVCLDDVQRLSSAPEMQDALISLIDKCRASGKLLVLAFDCAPHSCPGLKQKLRSRLASGLTVEVQLPDIDVRRQYIQAKNKLYDLGLEKDQILQLTRRHQDICAINGTLTRLAAFRTMGGGRGDSQGGGPADFLLDPEQRLSPLDADEVISIVCSYFSLDADCLTGNNRDRRTVLARSIAMLLCRELLGLSLKRTGLLFRGRDHSTVLHAVNKIKNSRDSDKNVHNMVEELRKLCLAPRFGPSPPAR